MKISVDTMDAAHKACAEGDKKETEAFMDQFMKKQPDLCVFLDTLSQEFKDEDAAELVFFMALVLARSFDMAGIKIGLIKADDVENAWNRNEQLAKTVAGDERAISDMASEEDHLTNYPEPVLLSVILSGIMEPDGAEKNVFEKEDDQSLAFLILKTFLDVLIGASESAGSEQ